MSHGQGMSGTLYGVGLGPGDPELVTVKAARVIGEADVVAYHSALIFNVLGVSGLGEGEVPTEIPKEAEQPIHDALQMASRGQAAQVTLLVASREDVGTQVLRAQGRCDHGPLLDPIEALPLLQLRWCWRRSAGVLHGDFGRNTPDGGLQLG